MCWEHNLEVRQTFLEDKVKQATMGEVAYNEARKETHDLETSIVIARLELRDLERDHSTISN
jgi:hypothetical protein